MRAKKKKLFDAVKMVREIRDARYKQSIDPNFDPKKLDLIKEKWTRLLEQQEREAAQITHDKLHQKKRPAA